jgi:peptide deformylase
MSPIVVVPNPVLRQVAKPVIQVDKKLLDLIEQMRQALLAARDPQGVGLAAPQVGVPLRLFLIRPDLRKKPRLFINPEIINYSQALQKPESKSGVYEGCLSVPHHYSPLSRSMSVTVKFQTLNLPGFASGTSPSSPSLIKEGETPQGGEVLKENTEVFTAFPAHVIQHEMDHLNGILFIDHVLSQNSRLYHIQGKVWEEVSL